MRTRNVDNKKSYNENVNFFLYILFFYFLNKLFYLKFKNTK